MKKIFLLIIILGLFGCVTNFVFISAVPSLFCVVFPVLILFRERIPKVTFWLLIFFLYALLSTALYAPQSFIAFGFYRYDANFIISYLPLLCLPLLSFNFDIDKIFVRLLYWATLLNAVMMGYFLISSGFHLDANSSSFGSLFIARNAAGGFLSIICGLAFVNFTYRRNAISLFVLLLNLFFLFATFSRGSMLGLVLGIGSFFLVKKGFKLLIPLAFATIICIQLFIIIQAYPVYKDLHSENELFSHREWKSVNPKTANLLIRAYWSWPTGIECFLHSPVFGAGFGAVNDLPLQFNSHFPVVQFNRQPDKVYGDNHAHHSYFHILGELGIIGLLLFFLFWYAIYRFLIKDTTYPFVRDFLLIALFNLTFASLTEHRITTPSSAIPFALSVGLFYTRKNFDKRQQLQNALILQND